VAGTGTGKPERVPQQGSASEIKAIDQKAYSAAVAQAQGKIDGVVKSWPE
jgi:hypothetical protein